MALPRLIALDPTNDASTQRIILDINIRSRVSAFAVKLTDLTPVKSNSTKSHVYVLTYFIDLSNNIC